MVATGDFTGSGEADLLFQDSDGKVDIVGASVIGKVGNPGPSWHVIGTGDYNGDGKSEEAHPPAAVLVLRSISHSTAANDRSNKFAIEKI